MRLRQQATAHAVARHDRHCRTAQPTGFSGARRSIRRDVTKQRPRRLRDQRRGAQSRLPNYARPIAGALICRRFRNGQRATPRTRAVPARGHERRLILNKDDVEGKTPKADESQFCPDCDGEGKGDDSVRQNGARDENTDAHDVPMPVIRMRGSQVRASKQLFCQSSPFPPRWSLGRFVRVE